MNEFLEQFLIESRELVEQATGDLLGLEEAPGDKARLDSAFRAFHTLKGAAGIMDFAAMGQLLHGAEDVLAAVRADNRPVTPALISHCLSCLDQVLQWLDVTEAEGAIPAVPAAAAQTFAAGFAADGKPAPDTPSPSVMSGPPEWVERILAVHPAQRQEARTVLRYTPDAACFFDRVDPLEQIAGLPGLLALDLSPTAPWPSLDEFDLFSCNLTAIAISSASPGDISARLGQVSGEAAIYALDDPPISGRGSGLSPEAIEVLRQQLLLAVETPATGLAGRLGSALRVAAQVLWTEGRPDDAISLQRAGDESLHAGDAHRFAAALEALLAEPAQTAPGLAIPEIVAAEPARALRVDVGRIDNLVKLAGELTVVKNALAHAASLVRGSTDPVSTARTLDDQQKRLDRLVAELQRSVIGMRVLPLRHVFQRLPRLVRDMGVRLGKSVRLVTEGDATEADKAIVEALFEPLLHVLRNAVDHGIEDEGERRAAGKTDMATIRLAALREGEHVFIEIIDDGRGMDLEKIRQIARQQGFVTAEHAAAMADDELAELIFSPGFSTAGAISDISGRGVGMDAVRSAITGLGGRVGVTSKSGEGVRVLFTLPFTVMISRIMTVEAGGQVFGIPLESVVETVRVPRGEIWPIGAAKAFVRRERTIPILSLTEALGFSSPNSVAADANIVVTSIGNELGALEVDRFGEPFDIMLQPMGGLLAGIRGIAGTTLLGDGRVLIVLDVENLLQ